MKNTLVKIHAYLLLVVGIINAIVGPIYLFSRDMIFLVLLGQATFVELPLLALSIIVIIYVKVKKLNKIYLVLPIFYLILYTLLAIFGAVISFNGINPLDLSSTLSLIGNIATEIFYIIQINFIVYLLKRK